MQQFLGILLFCAALVGCKEVTLQDGRIPAQYLKMARTIEGVYGGSFDGVRAEVRLHLEEDRLIFNYSDRTSNDMLGPECQSEVGKLKKILVQRRGRRDQITYLEFQFNPGYCSFVKGREVKVLFFDEQEFSVRILNHTKIDEDCDRGIHPPADPHACGRRWIEVHREGSFRRSR